MRFLSYDSSYHICFKYRNRPGEGGKKESEGKECMGVQENPERDSVPLPGDSAVWISVQANESSPPSNINPSIPATIHAERWKQAAEVTCWSVPRIVFTPLHRLPWLILLHFLFMCSNLNSTNIFGFRWKGSANQACQIWSLTLSILCTLNMTNQRLSN